ncbi:MAG: hypothetical protein ACLFP4_06835 [Spirochaetales bacterium]
MRAHAPKLTLACAICIVLLTSCGLLTQSPFPPWVGLVQRQASTGNEIEYDPMGEYRVHVVDDGTTEYVFVIADVPGKERAVAVYDSDLQVHFTLTEPFSSSLFRGDSVPVADANGRVYLELIAFGPGLTRVADLDSTSLRGATHVTSGSSPTFMAYGVGGTQLQADPYILTPDGSAGTPSFLTFDPATEANYESVYATTSHIAESVALVAFDKTSTSLAGFFSKTSDFATTNLVPATEVISTPGGFKFPVGFAPDAISATKSGVIIRGYGSEGQMLVAYSRSGNELGALRVDEEYEVTAASLAYDHIYIFAPEAETIRKLRPWW